MDEYTFIVLAKLKADRLKLEREQRASRGVQDARESEPIDRHRHSARTHWVAREPEWREQS